LFQQALSYDPLHEAWEKRLSRYFMFYLHMQDGPGVVMKELGEMVRELSLPLNKGDPDKSRKRFEKAMARLQKDRQIAQWHYVEDLTDLPARHWLPVWLSYHIQVTGITIPALVQEQKRTHGRLEAEKPPE
ncbi:MAG TPA: hypothetical protein VKR06_14175, partial [Ktedonosporobacter sp.]|nr:hypothetical protein [Ktedonosporobacter sp.]